MSNVVINEDESITVIAEETQPNSVVIDDVGTTSVVSVTAEGDNIIVSSETSPDLLMITTGGSAYVSAVNEGFVGSEVDWIYEMVDGRASVTYVNDIWAQLNNGISAQNTQLRQVIADENYALSQTITGLNAEFNGVVSNISTIETALATQEQALTQTEQTLRADFNSSIGAEVSLINTALSNADFALAQTEQELRAEYTNAINSEVNTLNTAISNANESIAQTENNLTASFTGGIESLNTELRQVISTESTALSQNIDKLESSITSDINAVNTTLTKAYTDLDSAVSTRITNMETEFNGKYATINSVDETISSSELSMASQRNLLEARVNDNIGSEINTVNTAIADEASTRSQAVISLQSDIDSKTQSNANLILETNDNVDGLTTAVAGLRTAVSGSNSQSEAELALESLVSDTETALSRAYLGVTNTVNGVSTVSGITIGGKNNGIDFRGNVVRLSNSVGDPKLYWDTVNDDLVINAKIVLGDGHTINNYDDVRGADAANYYIRPINGTAIKNNSGTLTIEGRKSENGVDTKFGYLRKKGTVTNLGSTATFTADDINGSLIVEMLVGDNVVDTITLADITDGADAVIGFIEANRRTWTQAKNNGAWPTDIQNPVKAKFYKDGTEIAEHEGIVSLTTGDGKVHFIAGTNYGGVTVSTLGEGTDDLTLTFTHSESGIQTSETFSAVSSGDKGDIGQSSFKSTAFIRSNSEPNKPSGGSYSSPIPATTGWSDGIPDGEEKLWQSVRIFTSDGQSPQTNTWSLPVNLANTLDFEVQYSTVNSSPGTPNTSPNNWVTSASSDAIWMATRKKENGVFTAWTTTQIKGEKGDKGDNARSLKLSSDSQSFHFDGDNNADPSNQLITFTVQESNLAGSLTISNNKTLPFGTDTNGNKTLSVADFGNNQLVTVTATKDGLSDEITIVRLIDGSENIVGYLSNESHNVSADSSGNSYSLTNSGGKFTLFKGSSEITSGASYTGSTTKNGLSLSIDNNGNYTLSGSSWTSDSEFFELSATYEGTTITKSFSIAKVKQGTKGNTGQKVFKSIIFKRANTKPNKPTNGSYSDSVPAGWEDGVPAGEAKLWQTTRIFTDDGLTPQQNGWTEPRQLTDTSTLDIEYSSSLEENPGTPSSPANGAVWGNTASTDTIWMAQRTKENGVFGAWTVSKIKGERGFSGAFFTGFERGEQGLVNKDSANNTIEATTSTYSGSTAYICRSTNGSPTNTGNGYTLYITIPENIALSFAGDRVEVTIYAKQEAGNGSLQFGVAYSTADTGNSGFAEFSPTSEWKAYSFKWHVTNPSTGGTDYLIIAPDMNGLGGGIVIDNITIKPTPEEPVQTLIQYSVNGNSWSNSYSITDKYMRTSTDGGETWSDAQKFIGENGDNGAYKEIDFSKGTSKTTAPPSGWQDGPPNISDTEYLWMRTRSVDKDGNKTAWSYSRISGVQGPKGSIGAAGAGMYGGTYASIIWDTATAVSRLESLAGRDIVQGDILTQTNTEGTNTEAKQYDGAAWISPQLQVNGSIVATGTLAGESIIAGTTINSPQISGGQLNIGSGVFTVNAAGDVGITSGSININAGNFSVNSDGDLTAKSASITGGNLNINDNFIVSTTGALTAKKGSINIGSGTFVVDTSGALTATSATITGSIESGSSITGSSFTGGSINIGNGNFTVDSQGNLNASSGTFSGTIGTTASINNKTPQEITSGITTAQGRADEAYNYADTTNSSLSTLKTDLGSLAYDSLVQKAKLGSTIIDGGYLRTDLVESGSIITSKLAVIGSGTNIVANPIFSNASSEGWNILNFTIISRDPNHWAGSVRTAPTPYIAYVPNDSNGYVAQTCTDIPCRPGEEFAISFDTSANGSTVNYKWEFSLVFDDENNNSLGGEVFTLTVDFYGWQTINLATVKAPPGAVKVRRLNIWRKAGGSGHSYLTNVRVEKMTDGNLIVDGAITGNKIRANTLIESPTIRGGRYELIGTNFMKVQAGNSFGSTGDLIEWYGPKDSNTFDSANNEPRYGNLSKANAITYLTDDGGAYFGGSIIAGTLKNAVQTTTKVYDPSVETGPYGSNGNTIEIKCSIDVSTSNQDGGICPTDPLIPQATLRLIRLNPNGTVEVASHVVTGDHTCYIEGSNPSGSERYQRWTLSGSFTFTDNISTTQDRNYRLEADIINVSYLTVNHNSSLNLSLISEEA